MGGGSQSTGEGFSRTTPGFTEELGAVLRASMEGKSGYSKQDAVADTQGLMRQQATNALQESMPKIAGMQNSAGAYGSTTKALLQNDLQARIMGQLAATQSQAIKDYAAIDADRIRAAAAATQASTASYRKLSRMLHLVKVGVPCLNLAASDQLLLVVASTQQLAAPKS